MRPTLFECGDQSSLQQMHAGNGDMTDLGRRFVTCFVQAADVAGLPDDADFRVALRAYMEWAVAPWRTAAQSALSYQ